MSNVFPEGINIDMRSMNKVKLANRYPFEPHGPAVILGPGSTWGRVLKYVPPDRYTMIHGVCTDVGVGGFLLGGGVNYVGTSQRYLSGSSNVLEYTMVDAEGDIYKVTSIKIILANQYIYKNKYWANIILHTLSKL